MPASTARISKLLISGDQVLPRISSNVSVYPIEPEADPMSDWLASLHKLKREVPDDVLVLPSHNECFRGLHARIDWLHAGSSRRSTGCARCCTSRGARSTSSAPVRPPHRPKDIPLLGMATGESLACLNYLLHRGEVVRELDDAGVAWYGQV